MKPLFFATTPRGTEQVLAEELRDLGLLVVAGERGGVAFGESLEDAYRACLWSRIASRVLRPLASFRVDGADALYKAVHAIAWTSHIGPEKTLAVDVAGGDSPAGPPHFVTLKTKDAIVDRIRQEEGERPSIDTENANVRVNIHLAGPRVNISLDVAGRGLHHRGIGRAGATAPLKENLAAAILRLAGWHEHCADEQNSTPLFDPMCGSGTLLIEAAWMALDVAPGLQRQHLGAAGWRDHDAALWRRLLAEARQRRDAGKQRQVRLAGNDASPQALAAARINLRAAGVSSQVRLAKGDLQRARPPWSDAGLVITNPPYGARLGETAELGPLYELLGDVLKHRFPGWTAWVMCGESKLAKRIGLRPAARHILFNGPIECRLLKVPIADAPVQSTEGPGWRKPGVEAHAFGKKLRKNLRQLGPWAKRAGLSCYRVYDTDMPLYNLAVDWYDGAVRVEEYARPRRIDEEAADKRLRDALLMVAEVFEINDKDIVLRQRVRRRPGEQHERRSDHGELRQVREGDLRFLVNLTDYLDTGLFLDDRLIRRYLRQQAAGGDFLNLFAYTCTASVAAAIGGARSTTSVDLSNTYLNWGRRNFAANGLDRAANHGQHQWVRGDVMGDLGRPSSRRYDLIFVAPPTASRSKAMRDDFDIQRDHRWLLMRCVDRLKPGGEIVFTTNQRDFVLDDVFPHAAREITEEMTPRDFARRPRLHAWTITSSGK